MWVEWRRSTKECDLEVGFRDQADTANKREGTKRRWSAGLEESNGKVEIEKGRCEEENFTSRAQEMVMAVAGTEDGGGGGCGCG